jgi:hypothetical protein
MDEAMSLPKGEKISPPSPELLAAYVDGEFEGTEELAWHKQSIEEWLEQHPEAAADIVAWRRLKQLCQRTAPVEPAESVWNELWRRMEWTLRQPEAERPPHRRMAFWLRGVAAAAILLACSASAWLVWRQLAQTGSDFGSTSASVAERNAGDSKDPPQEEVYPVATADEITILHVEGDDTATLVVGQLPVNGTMELVEPQEFFLNSVEPAPGDDMVPSFKMDQGSPMIWAPLKRERTGASAGP